MKPQSLLLLIIFSFSNLTFAQDSFDDGEDIEFDGTAFLENIDEESTDELSDLTFDDEDLSNVPMEEEPKLNPNTKIIATKNGKYIYHPNQEKGLYKINRSNEYQYKYKKSPLKGFIHVKGGNFNFENFPNKDSSLKFSDYYDKDSLVTAFFEYEWQPMKKYRSLSLKVGGGVAYARGNGRFVAGVNAGVESSEAYTFMMFPINAGLVYKFKYIDDQLFIPFASGSLDYNLATEFRSGFEAFKYSGILGAHFGGGALLNLGWLERSAALELDKEFGINNTYFSLEARQVISFDTDKDISGFMFLAGLSFEY